MLLERLKASTAHVPTGLTLTRTWRGSFCRATLRNPTVAPITVPEVVLFDVAHGLASSTPLYAEAFQMLCQLAGTLERPTDVGYYPDRTHYKIPEPENLRTSYGMLMLAPQNQERVLLGFTSCKRFIGRFSFDATRLRISLDTENKTIAPGERWELEEFLAISGTDREALLDKLTRSIAKHHPKLTHNPVPTGWCSWYCFGALALRSRIKTSTTTWSGLQRTCQACATFR